MKPKLWLGLASVGALLTTSVFAGQRLADDNAGLINDALGLNQKKIDVIEETDDVEGSAYTEEDGSLSDASWRRMIKDSYKFCEEAVEQGSVLFKNENDALPLKESERNVTLLGRGSRNLFMRSGAGGAAPNTNLVVRLDAAFKDNGFSINEELFKGYSEEGSMTSPGTNVEKFSETKESAISADYGDAAIITFVRIGTENTDPSAGQLDLKTDEINLLKLVKQYKDNGTFKKIIVMVNSPLAMSMDWADDDQYGIDAVVYMGVPGYYGAGGIVHVLMGKDAEGNVINPSGHAPDTFAASASSSAAYQNFGDRNVVVYKEGVYVGYKYYETRYEDLILDQGSANSSKGVYKSTGEWNYADEMGYPFGFGLSYTTFNQKLLSVTHNEKTDQIEAEVEVENTGDMDGKCSVQLYVQAPYTDFDKANGLGKSAIALMAYNKIDVKAGEKQTTKLAFDRYFLTTYDYKVNGSYILEEGDYYFAVGNGAHEALNNVIAFKAPQVAGSLYDHNGDSYSANTDAVKMMSINADPITYKTSHYSEEEVVNQFDDADYNWFVGSERDHDDTKSGAITYLNRQDWEGTWPTKTTSNPAGSADTDMSNYYKAAPEDGPKYTDGDGEVYNVELDEPIVFADMAKVPLEGEVEDEESKFYGEEGSEIWDQFISQMNLDDLCISVSDNRGILDVKKVMKPGNSVAEGPEGLLSPYQYGDKRWATGFPTGPTYTGTWDHDMQKKFGEFYGEDAIYCGVACVNAPGANINRTPYGSRASEYMSEDAILNYNTAANIVGAARKKGLIMNIKHCFLNNQETGRQGVATFCNEQAIREIYLRPFEGALTKGKGLGIMTSYNRIGVRYAACHEPLMMNVMRGEWAYKGLIIDDALTGNNTSNYSNGPAMLHSGTDLFCLDGQRGSQLKQWVEQKDDGTLLLDLQRANKYIMYSMSRSWMGGITPVTEEEMEAAINPTWKKTVSGITIGTTAAAGTLFAVYAVFEVLGFMAKKKIEGQEAQQFMLDKFLKNKGIGYYLVAVATLLALITAIVFFMTYKTPTLEAQMGNKASGFVVETIGVFLIAGVVVELVVLAMPEFRFFQIAAVVMFGLAFYKDILVIPDFIIGKINNVEYNGGNFGLNMFFFVAILLVVLLAVVAPFIGLVKENVPEEENDDE